MTPEHDIPDGAIARRLVMMRVGEEIYRLRQGKITLRALAERIGVSAPFLSDVEHGRRSVTKHLNKIAKVLGVKPRHFVEVCGICPTCGGTGVSETTPKRSAGA